MALPGFYDRCTKIQVPWPRCRKTGEEDAMETAFAFKQRMREDAEFRQKVNACADGVDRLRFLKSEGYDFTPFVHILNNCSSPQPTSDRLKQPGKNVSHRQRSVSLFIRITRIFRIP